MLFIEQQEGQLTCEKPSLICKSSHLGDPSSDPTLIKVTPERKAS